MWFFQVSDKWIFTLNILKEIRCIRKEISIFKKNSTILDNFDKIKHSFSFYVSQYNTTY